MAKLVNLFSGTQGSSKNNGVTDFDNTMYSSRVGKKVISVSNSDRASAIIVSEDEIRLTDGATSGGVMVNKNGVNIQGPTYFTVSGKNIRKGPYSENPKSTKIFTYKETVLLESMPIEIANQVAGQVAGMNVSMDGNIPIMTDIAAGPLPHFHSISMKHVHRLEPAYLYCIPPVVSIIKGAMTTLTDFFKA